LVVIKTVKFEEIEVDELVQFTLEAEQQLDKQLRSGQTKKDVESFIRGTSKLPFYFITARENGKLIGYAGLYEMSDSMVYLDSW
jgi:hypothetical protein